MNSVSPDELEAWTQERRHFTLLDVREDFEREIRSLGGLHIPLAEVMQRAREIPLDHPVVCYCEKGIRSAIAVQRLTEVGFAQLYNLSGGIQAARIPAIEASSSNERLTP